MNMHVKPKLVAGQKVKVIKLGPFASDITVGNVYDVLRTFNDGDIYIKDDVGDTNRISAANVELAPRFAVGDKVRSKGAPEAGVAIVEYVKPEGGYRIRFKDTWFGVCHGDDDDLTPAYTSCAAAEVDNLAAEYGAAKKDGEYQVGDKIRVIKKGYGGSYHSANVGDVLTVTGIEDYYGENEIHTEKWFFHPNEIEHVAVAPATATATLTIEAGKFYKTRDGRKALVAVNPHGEKLYPYCYEVNGAEWHGITGEGKSCIGVERSDLVAEWTDEPAADRVPGYRFTAKNPPKPGDRVSIGDNGTFTVKEVLTNGNIRFVDRPRDLTWLLHNYEGASNCTLVAPAGSVSSIANIVAKHSQTGTAIVCLLENGKPAPATQPFVHGNADYAAKEAARLANVHKGKEFGVYTLGTVAKVERTYDHEWQRLAAGGQKISGIKSLRAKTGLGLATAKDAVEDWLRREAA